MEHEEKLKRLTLHALKELGEIAEVLIKQDRPDHWEDELSDLSDLCGLCIKPMLKLAGTDFETACKIGMDRRLKKMELRRMDKSTSDTQEAIQQLGV